jgi:hypothetical protein
MRTCALARKSTGCWLLSGRDVMLTVPGRIPLRAGLEQVSRSSTWTSFHPCPTPVTKEFRVSSDEGIARGMRNHPTKGRYTSGTTPLRRLDTFSGGAKLPRTRKPRCNRNPESHGSRFEDVKMECTAVSFCSLTEGCFSISKLGKEEQVA